MYEELGPEGISRMVGDLRDLYSQDRLRQGNGGDRTTTSNESLRDSFIDLLNYSAIAIMVLDNNWPEVQTLDCE